MSVLNFAEEFTRLIVRYTKTSSPNNELSRDAIVPLNYDQITNTIYQVFSAIGIKDCNDNVNSLVKTPVNTIDVTTPTAPIVLKNNRKQNDNNDFRSEDSLPTNFSASDMSLTANEKEVESSVNELQNEKKFLSQSNPIICVSRSDTFVREKKQKTNTDDDDNDVFQDNSMNTETNYSVHNNLLLSLNEVQKSIMSVVTKVEHIKKQVYPQMAKQDNFNGKQTRRLNASLSNGSVGLNHTPSKNKTNLPKIRRSITAFSGTPTSSRSSSIDRENTFDRRKSTSIVISGKLSESKKLGNSMSNLNLSLCNKMPSDSIPKRIKNPKYAHVQSTIPKPTQTKKKMQSPKVQ